MSASDQVSGPAGHGSGQRHRLSQLLGMHVVYGDGRDGDQVTDVRLSRSGTDPAGGELVVVGLVVGPRRPGSYFGYDRHPSMGPWLLRALIRFLHRHTGYVSWDDVDHVDWERRVVRLHANELQPPARR